jgi:GxxExxY protein
MQPRRRGGAENERGEIKMRFDEFRARHGEIEPELDALTERIIGACIEVHKWLGPGLTELLYQEALCHEFDLRGIRYEKQVKVPVVYKGKPIGETRIDVLVEGSVIVELKACDALNAVHRAQLICYLRLKNLELGLLVNFNVAILKDGLKRVILSL